MKRILMIVCLLGSVCSTATAQKYPERRHIRSGNEQYEKGDYSEAEVSYLRALEKTPDSYEGAFNLSDALYKQQRYEEAAEISGRLAADSLHGEHAAQAWFNRGNALFQQRKLEEALEAYKNSLRLNPEDMEAKFNYAYTKKLLEKDRNDQNQDQNQDQQNQNRNNDQNGNDDKNQDPQQNDDKNDGQNDPNDDKKENGQQPDGPQPDDGSGQDGQQPPQPQGMNREEAERMLDAIQGSENDTKKKVDARKAKSVGSSGKNW